MNKKSPLIFISALSLLGILDTGYLTYEHFQNATPACSLLNGCELVLTSTYSVIMGIPLSLLGLVYYLILIGLSLYGLYRNSGLAYKLIALVSGAGFLASLYLVYLQKFVIESWCQYCLFSATITTIIFIISTIGCWIYKTHEN